MSIQPGQQLAHYRIVDKLGEGGMGEVWRATDTQLDREVAIKVLPAAFTEDPERLARFEREAKLLAQLHHPNIASIFGLEESDGIRALVMELVEGPTLAERIEAGPLPLSEVLSVAKQIAEALEEAHEKGIVHRDLKPQNVKASAEGKVKVLDFGLAKAMDPTGTASGPGSASQLAASPTLTLGATVQGVILGTAGYMAPEQAAGGVADRRADVWSFGVLLYEMLTGRRLFEGETVSHVLAGVLREEPDFTALPDGTPPRIARLVRRCLRKKARERLQAIGDARLVIEEVLAGEQDEPVAAPDLADLPAPRPAWQLGLALAVAVGAGIAAAVLLLGGEPAGAPAPRTLSELTHPSGMQLAFPALSPSGQHLAMAARDRGDGEWRIWVRTLATGDLRALEGTESGTRPFWSPDGKSIGYFDFGQGAFKRVDLEGGRPVQLVKAASNRSRPATWGERDIVFVDASDGSLKRVSPTGGEISAVTRPSGDVEHWSPTYLDGDRKLLYNEVSREGQSVAVVSDRDGENPRTLMMTDTKAVFWSGKLYYGRGGTLLARPFDPSTGELIGDDSEIVLQGIDDWRGGQFSVGAGLLVYLPDRGRSGSRITIYDRGGKELDQIDSETFLDDLVLSPDGRRAAVMKASETGDGVDVWTLDLERRIFDRATYGERDDDPVFSPDGEWLAFAHAGDLYVKPANGAGEPRLVVETEHDIVTNDWSSDGTIVFSDIGGEGEDLFAVAAEGGESRQLTATPFHERNAEVSPDGRWLAYASDEGGDFQVYLTTWPELDGKWRVSSERAAMPRWREDGRELFFLAHDHRLMSASVELDGRAPRLGLPEAVFEAHDDVTYTARTSRWAVQPDGQSFLVLEPISGEDDQRESWMLLSPLGERGR